MYPSFVIETATWGSDADAEIGAEADKIGAQTYLWPINCAVKSRLSEISSHLHEYSDNN